MSGYFGVYLYGGTLVSEGEVSGHVPIATKFLTSKESKSNIDIRINGGKVSGIAYSTDPEKATAIRIYNTGLDKNSSAEYTVDMLLSGGEFIGDIKIDTDPRKNDEVLLVEGFIVKDTCSFEEKYSKNFAENYYVNPFTIIFRMWDNNTVVKKTTQTATYGNELTLAQNTFTLEGYTFYRWGSKKDTEGTYIYTSDNAVEGIFTYSDGQKLEVEDVNDLYNDYPASKYGNNVYLNAYWTKNYTVSFDANDGDVDTESKSVAYGLKYGELPEPEKTGFEFMGWYYEDELVGAEDLVAVERDHMLVAQWKELTSEPKPEEPAPEEKPEPKFDMPRLNLRSIVIDITEGGKTNVASGRCYGALGSTHRLTLTPDEGYEIGEVLVNGKPVEANKNGKISFVVKGNTYVEVEFVEIED